MTTHSNRLNSFTLKFGQGRTAEPLDILGQEVLVKLTNADTNGATAIFHLTVPPMSGPPLHRHSREDEWFYVLQGRITVEINGQPVVLDAGGSGFASRGTVHTCYCRRRHETGEVKEWMPLEAKLTGYRVVATLLFVTALLLFS